MRNQEHAIATHMPPWSFRWAVFRVEPTLKHRLQGPGDGLVVAGSRLWGLRHITVSHQFHDFR
jgi:hypothetical protein